jgi:hypothetical protein
MNTRSVVMLACVGLTACGSCSDSPTSPPYDLQIPASWAAAVTNPLFPLTPGTTTEFRAQTSEGVETIRIEVLTETRQIQGVTATVVRDRVYLNGSLIEDTYDWFAQDSEGNVWYLGEDSREIANGVVLNTEGSWEWGKDGALPGIYMWADPSTKVGQPYRQEYYRGVAEDWGKVITLNVSVTVPLGSYTGCITTDDWVGLEPDDPHELKTYCPQIGLVREGRVGATSGTTDLISRTTQ